MSTERDAPIIARRGDYVVTHFARDRVAALTFPNVCPLGTIDDYTLRVATELAVYYGRQVAISPSHEDYNWDAANQRRDTTKHTFYYNIM